MHGWGGSFESTWQQNGFTELLRDAGRSVIGVDLLGHGSAEKPHDPQAYDNLAAGVIDVMPPEPVDAIGFSLGAITLLQVAIEHPQRSTGWCSQASVRRCSTPTSRGRDESSPPSKATVTRTTTCLGCSSNTPANPATTSSLSPR